MSLLDLIYPPMCMACRVPLSRHARFCQECKDQLQLLPKEGHCLKCFREVNSLEGTCEKCRTIASPFKRVGVCFDSFGPGESLLQENEPKDLAAFLLMQLENLSYPSFDLLTTIPTYLSNPLAPVAKELSKLIEVPFLATLQRSFTPQPQFTLKKKCNIINKRVLLLQTACKQPEELRVAGWALKVGLPETLYGLSFCAILY